MMTDQECPNCNKPCPPEERIAGVCPACKRLLNSVHARAVAGKVKEIADEFRDPKHIAGETYFDESGNAQSANSELTEEEWMRNMCIDHGFTSLEAFMDCYAEIANHLGDTGEKSSASQAVDKMRDLITRVFNLVQDYERQHGDRMMAERCAWLLLEFPMLAGELPGGKCVKTCDDIVRLTGKKKQTINKCLIFLQSQAPELPLIEGQRKPEAKENMRKAQHKIWHRE